MASVARVGRGWRITIPRAVRRRLEVREGDSVAFLCRDDQVVLVPLNKTLFELRGSIPVSGPQDFSAIRRQVVEIGIGSCGERER